MKSTFFNIIANSGLFYGLVIIVMSALSTPIFANPAPFGLEIGRADVAQVNEKYKTSLAGINQYSLGQMVDVDVSDIRFEGLQDLRLIFSKKGKLQAVIATLSKNRFDSLYRTMKTKYRLSSSQIPFVGNKSAKFMNGTTEITLNAPHLSFEMTMNYIDQSLLKVFKKQSQKARREKSQQEASQL